MQLKRTTKKEMAICRRLKWAREELGLTQKACAELVGLERGTLANYEIGRTPVRHEIALRFCHFLIVSEEWLATGKHGSMMAACPANNVKLIPGDHSLDSIFFRQSMDLISDPVCASVPAGMAFSEAYPKFLQPRYSELAKEFFHAPRVVYSVHDLPERNLYIVGAYLERWLKMLANQALVIGDNQRNVQNEFTRQWLAAGGIMFKSALDQLLAQRAAMPASDN